MMRYADNVWILHDLAESGRKDYSILTYLLAIIL